VRKKRNHQGIRGAFVLASIALAICAAFLIINACAPKSTAKTSKENPYGTPEYVIELPPGYEDLEVLPEQQSLSIAPTGTEQIRQALPQAPQTEAPPIEGKAFLIIVIDDVGYTIDELSPFLKLPFSLTFAVMPKLPHSADSTRAIRDAGKEFILHQPMEALGGNDPGPGAIYLSMDAQSIEKIVEENIESFPFPPAGLNNHMGSAVTRNRDAMTALLKLVKKRGMYYLDSLTAPGTVSGEICRETGTKYLERTVFLDNKSERESILSAIEEGKVIARKNHAAIMIGHVWSANLAATLMEVYPELVEEGYSLSTISEFMQIQAEENTGNARSGD